MSHIIITRQMVADKLAAYLQHDLSLADLVAWAEWALMDGEFEDQHFTAIRDVIARLGVSDVRAFGLTWDDCEHAVDREQLAHTRWMNAASCISGRSKGVGCLCSGNPFEDIRRHFQAYLSESLTDSFHCPCVVSGSP